MERGAVNPSDIYRNGLLSGGLPPHVVDGIMMNAADESGFDFSAVGDNGAAFGSLQWNGPRKRALFDFASGLGRSPSDPDVQAQFTLHELNGPERAAYTALMGSTNAGEAGAIFVNQFERPAEEHRARREAAYLGGTGRTTGAGTGGTYSPPNAFAANGQPPQQPQAQQNALAEPPRPDFGPMDVNAFARPLQAYTPQAITFQRRV